MSKIYGNIQTNATNQIASTYQDTGVANAYVVATRPAALALTYGLAIKFEVANANTGPSTVNVDGLGDVPIKKDVIADLSANDFLDGSIVELTYDGTNFQWQGAKFSAIQNGVVFGGQVTWIGPGFTYRINAAGYYINFQYFTSPDTIVVLSPSDPDLGRFDTFIVDNTGTASVVEGTPLDTPTEPPLDLGVQLRLSAALVDAAAVEPAITSECIYLENTEWTTGGTNGGRINPNSTTLPRFGVKDINGTNVSPNDFITFARGSSLTPMPTFSKLNLWVRAKSGWGINTRLVFQWYNGAATVGNAVSLQPGTFSFIASDTTNYQNIVFPLSSFGLNTTSVVTELRITAISPSVFNGFYIDDMCLLAGDVPPTNMLPTFQNWLSYNPGTNAVEFGNNPLLHNTTADTASFITTFSGATVFDYPIKFSQRQSFQNSTSIVSFQSNGSNLAGALDLTNPVKLGVNYTGEQYNVGDTISGFMGPDFIGYWLGVNAKGHGSFGIDSESSSSKSGGIFIHTLDGVHTTNMVSIFGKQPPNANQSFNSFLPYFIASFKTTGGVQFQKYGDLTFEATPTSFAGFDTNGNIVEIDPDDVGGGGTTITADNGLKMSTATNVELGGPQGDPGFLLQDTYINTDNKALHLYNSSASTETVLELIANNSLGGYALLAINHANLSGQIPTAIRGVADGDLGVGVSGVGTWFGGFFSGPIYGLRGGSTSGTAILADTTNEAGLPLLLSPMSATGTTTPTAIRIQTSLGGPTVGDGIGSTIDFFSTFNGPSFINAGVVGRVTHKLTSADQSVLNSQFSIDGVYHSTTLQQILALAGSGSLRLNKYGVGSFPGTPTYMAGFDTSGNVIEVEVGGGGGGATRFAVSGEDAVAAQARSFSLNGHDFLMTTSTGGYFAMADAGSWTLTGINQVLGSSHKAQGTVSFDANSVGGSANARTRIQAEDDDHNPGDPTTIEVNSWDQTARIYSPGGTLLQSYGTGTITGTDAYWLAVTSAGKIIEMPAPSGGSTSRFGFPGEDDTAGAARLFDTNGFDFVIGGIATSGIVFSNSAKTAGLERRDGSAASIIQAAANNGGTIDFTLTTIDGAGHYVFLTGDGTTGKLNVVASAGVNFSGYGSGSFSGTPAFNLSVDSSGNLIETALGGGGGSSRFGFPSEDDVAGEDRQFDLVDYNINILTNSNTTGVGGSGLLNVSLGGTESGGTTTTAVNITNTRINASGINFGLQVGVSNGSNNVGIYVPNGDLASIWASSSVGRTFWGQSADGVGLDIETGATGLPILATADHDGGTTETTMLELMRTSPDTPGVGFGQSIDMYLENTTSAVQLSTKLASFWKVATAGSETSEFDIRLAYNGAAGIPIAKFAGDKIDFQIDDGYNGGTSQSLIEQVASNITLFTTSGTSPNNINLVILDAPTGRTTIRGYNGTLDYSLINLGTEDLIPEFTDNTAATGAGLLTGDVYRTGDFLKIVHL